MRYRAFISYASADRVVGARFHRAIEHFRIPKPLRGREHGRGPVPARLTPLFRDRTDADAGVRLADTLRAALEGSDALVVLCSPAAAQSPWVNEEIRTFKALGRGDRIVAVLVGGSPCRYDAQARPDGAFPPALFERRDAAGAVVVDDSLEPLAADLRITGDGFDMARLKVVAALTGVPLTLLTQRQHEAERRERRIVRLVAALMMLLAVAATAAAVRAKRSGDLARTRLAAANEILARRMDDAVRFREAYGVPIAVTERLLAGAGDDFRELLGSESGVPALEMQRGRLLVLLSDLYRVVGDREQQLAFAREGVAALDRIPTSRRLLRPATWFVSLPDRRALAVEQLGASESLASALADRGDARFADVLSQGLRLADRERLSRYTARLRALEGETRYIDGDLEGARTAYDAAIEALDRMPATERTADDQFALAIARSERAEILLESGRRHEALAEQHAVVSALEGLSSTAPASADVSRSLAHALSRRGDMQYAVTIDWTRSLPDHERALQVLERLHASDRARTDYARDLSIALERIGDIRLQQRELDTAAGLFDRAVRLRRDGHARDPQSGEVVRDLAVGLERQGDVALARGRAADALVHFDEARTLREADAPSGAAADEDPVLRRDLAVLWSKIAGARLAGRRRDWEPAYARAIGLLTPIADTDDAPLGWLRDLAVFRDAYAQALRRAGRSGDAQAQWRLALALIDRQLEADPGDPRLVEDRKVLAARIR